jgi:hypothetical protein
MIVIVFVWQIATRRAATKQPVTPNATLKDQPFGKFCNNCDNPIGMEDKFCSKCGAATRGE